LGLVLLRRSNRGMTKEFTKGAIEQVKTKKQAKGKNLVHEINLVQFGKTGAVALIGERVMV